MSRSPSKTRTSPEPATGAEEVRLLQELATLLGPREDFDPTLARVQHIDREVYRVGTAGVVAFFGDYALCGWPDEDQRPASRDAYWVLRRRLDERGMTRHMVHPANFRSVKLTTRLGARPIGVDPDGYIHYILTRERFGRHGKEVAAAEGS